MIVLAITMVIVAVAFGCYIRVMSQEYKKTAICTVSQQKKVQENQKAYCCKNTGESLDECEIYDIPYEATGC